MKNPLKKFDISSIFAGKSNSFIGVDIGSSSIKVVQLRKKKGTAVLETYGELSLGPYAQVEVGQATNLSPEELSKALASLMIESKVTGKECGVSIPLRSSLVFTMEMPNVSEKQLSQMIPIEARKYVPVPMAEVDLDWKIIPKKSSDHSSFLGEEEKTSTDKEKSYTGEKIDILVAAIHKETIARQQNIVKNAGLDLKFLEIEIFSTLRAVAGTNMLNFAVLDMGAGSSKLYIVERGIVMDSHMIPRGSQSITLNISRSTGISVEEAEKLKKKVGVVGGEVELEKNISNIVSSNLEHIFSEANKVILSYQKKHNKNIDKLIITGGGSIINGMLGFASSRVETEVSISDPFSKVESPAFLDSLLKEVGPGFTVALGIALRGLRSMK